eukprot:3806693-Karenia_brevis.AAC.1
MACTGLKSQIILTCSSPSGARSARKQCQQDRLERGATTYPATPWAIPATVLGRGRGSCANSHNNEQ